VVLVVAVWQENAITSKAEKPFGVHATWPAFRVFSACHFLSLNHHHLKPHQTSRVKSTKHMSYYRPWSRREEAEDHDSQAPDDFDSPLLLSLQHLLKRDAMIFGHPYDPESFSNMDLRS